MFGPGILRCEGNLAFCCGSNVPSDDLQGFLVKIEVKVRLKVKVGGV